METEPRYPTREAVEFPTKPPYTAHLGNLDYNVTSVDIEGFLSDCQVTTVRIMEDKVDRKPKGFGYVEFATPEGLRNALAKSESSFMGRNIKISVADPRKSSEMEP
jgi:translation initiation factor 4B